MKDRAPAPNSKTFAFGSILKYEVGYNNIEKRFTVGSKAA